MPSPMARRGESIVTGSPSEQDLSFVGLMEPVEHVHQGRLARAVLPEQRVDLATAQLEVHRVVRDQGPEPLGDPSEFERGRVSHCLLDRVRDVGELAGGDLVLTSLTWSAYLAPTSLVSPMPTPPDLTSKIVLAPPLNVPSWTALIASKTATSTFFRAEVMIWSPR